MVGGLVGLLLYVMGNPERYKEMSEGEFAQEAKKKSLLGAAITGLEGTLRKGAATNDGSKSVKRDATPSPADPQEEEAGSSPPRP